MADPEPIDKMVDRVGSQVNVELLDRVDALEEEVQILLMAVALIGAAVFLLARELYEPEGKTP